MTATFDIRTSESKPFILLPTFIDGKGPFSFILDTGANVSIITESLAGILEIKDFEAKEALGAGGSRTCVPVGRVGSITVGGARIEGARLGVVKSLPRCVGEGVLGHDFLKHFRVSIDYRLLKLTLVNGSLTPARVRRSYRLDLPKRLR